MWNEIKNIINNLEAIEMGGPTILFQNSFLIYDILKSVDGINLKENNYWQDVGEKYNYFFGKNGEQIIADVSDLSNLSLEKKYEIILNSHVIEHIANPIKAIKSWKNLLKEEGFILSFVPNQVEFWDRIREETSFDHILNDYLCNIQENDLTHLEENLQTEHLQIHPRYSEKCKNNILYRVIHHHCFNLELVKKMHEYCGFKTIKCFVPDYDKLQIIYLGSKI